jgi:ketosteroid isomerase-like protein
MPQEDVEIVRTIYERWEEGDFRGGIEFFDPQVVMVISDEFPEPGTHLGVEAIGEWTRQVLLEAWTDFAIEAEDVVSVGDCVLAQVRQNGVGRGSGAPSDFRYFMLWSLRGGKAIRMESFRERAAALAAAGVSE